MYANNFFRLIKIALVICFGMPLSVRAAEFVKSPSSNGEPDIILVVGKLVPGDEKQFINIALNSGNAIVVFESRGGSLLAGIEIGKTIRLKGFATFVPDTVQCASACALAWLGGRIRFMSNSARVGFHAAYVDDGGQAAVSSAGKNKQRVTIFLCDFVKGLVKISRRRSQNWDGRQTQALGGDLRCLVLPRMV
jgi:hypothetical protein